MILDTHLVDEMNKKHAHELLRNVAESLLKKGFQVEAYAMVGEAKECIVKKVDQLKPKLLVMGSRGILTQHYFLQHRIGSHQESSFGQLL